MNPRNFHKTAFNEACDTSKTLNEEMLLRPIGKEGLNKVKELLVAFGCELGTC